MSAQVDWVEQKCVTMTHTQTRTRSLFFHAYRTKLRFCIWKFFFHFYARSCQTLNFVILSPRTHAACHRLRCRWIHSKWTHHKNWSTPFGQVVSCIYYASANSFFFRFVSFVFIFQEFVHFVCCRFRVRRILFRFRLFVSHLSHAIVAETESCRK